MGRPLSAIISAMTLVGLLLLATLAAISLTVVWETVDVQRTAQPAAGQDQPQAPATVVVATGVSQGSDTLAPAEPALSLSKDPVPTARLPGATAIPFPAPTPGPAPTPFPAASQNPRFGIAWSSSMYNSQRVALPTGRAIEAGASWDRWPMPWYLVEPHADGHFRWVQEDINFFLAATQDRPGHFDPGSNGPVLNILVVLTGIPEAYVRVREGRIETILGLDEPAFLAGDGGDGQARINPENRWGHFVYQATSTFGDVVDGWEIGNEGGFPLPPAAYARAMEVACQVIAITDPTAEVLLGSPVHPVVLETAQGKETAYGALLRTLATAVRGNRSLRACIGGLALHVYVRPDYSHYVISGIAELTADLGWRPALWITETGIQHPDRDGPGRARPDRCRETGFSCVSDEEQASYLIQQYALAAQALAQKQRDGVVIYHRLKDEFDHDPRPEVNDGPWGLMDFDNGILPAYNAARLVSATLGGARYLREEGTGDPTYRHLLFMDPSRRLVRVLWATTSEDVMVSVPLRSGQFICYQQDVAFCPGEFRHGTDGVLTLTLPGATAQARGDPGDPFYPAPVVGGRTFIVVE